VDSGLRSIIKGIPKMVVLRIFADTPTLHGERYAQILIDRAIFELLDGGGVFAGCSLLCSQLYNY
jgi:hypothetical protein